MEYPISIASQPPAFSAAWACAISRRDDVQSVLAGKDRRLRFELLHRSLDLVGFAVRDVRRIADDEVEIVKRQAVSYWSSTRSLAGMTRLPVA